MNKTSEIKCLCCNGESFVKCKTEIEYDRLDEENARYGEWVYHNETAESEVYVDYRYYRELENKISELKGENSTIDKMINIETGKHWIYVKILDT